MHSAAMVRSKKSTRITVNLRDEEHAALSTLAEQHDVSLSRITRQAITEFLDRHGKGEAQIALTFPAASGESGS